MSSPPFWLIGESEDVLTRTLELEDRRPPALIVDYDHEAAHKVSDRQFEAVRMGDVAGMARPKNPTEWKPMTLTVTEESFYPDFFVRSAWFVSAKLREIMGVGDDVAQYLDVDCAGCHAGAGQQDYKEMDTFAIRRAIDIDRTEMELRTYPERDGTTSEWQTTAYGSRLYWRDDFVSDVPIFRDPHDPRWFATDAFAEKVLRAGITDMVFQDITSDRAQTDFIIKSL